MSYEQEMFARIWAALDSVDAELRAVWHLGDGEGGFVIEELHRRYTTRHHGSRSRREKIDHSTRRAAYERDQYRCVECGTHIDLTLDHVNPVSLGGASTLENLATMCRSCNSRKGARRPEGST